MRTEFREGVLSIFPQGKVDSSNALQTEAAFNEAIAAAAPSSLIIDASRLEYISSAGLRIFLKMKKRFKDLRVINVNPDVYEIFSMTGFTEIMTVEKALRELSVDGCEIIDRGAYGTIYRIDPDTIVKVYDRLCSIDDVNRERKLARKAFILGIPTAIPYDVVKVGNLYGAVFELLNAKSFAQLIREGEDVPTLAKLSTDILKIIHGITINDAMLPPQKPVATGWAKKSAQYLPPETGDRLIRLFEEIPETNNMMHGDFHIKNILRQKGEDLLIDMDTLSTGHPIYELSAIFSAYEGFASGGTSRCTDFLGITKEQCRTFLDETFRSYFDDRSEEEIAQIVKKAALISYTRIYRWLIERYGEDSREQSASIAFCRHYLIENTPLIDQLYY